MSILYFYPHLFRNVCGDLLTNTLETQGREEENVPSDIFMLNCCLWYQHVLPLEHNQFRPYMSCRKLIILIIAYFKKKNRLKLVHSQKVIRFLGGQQIQNGKKDIIYIGDQGK